MIYSGAKNTLLLVAMIFDFQGLVQGDPFPDDMSPGKGNS
jgi:hypothetical protein